MVKNNFKNTRDFAMELVESYIADNNLQKDDRLPSEREMCQMWDLNRTTLRSAIQRLVETGQVYKRVGSGTYIAHPKMVRNLQDVKGFSEAVNAAGYTPSSQIIEAQIREANKAIAKKMHLTIGSKVFVLCRARAINSKKCSIETTYINAQLCPDIEKYDFEERGLFDILKNDYKIFPHKGDEKLNLTLLTEEEAKILEMDAGHPAIYQSGTIYNEENVAIEYFKGIILNEYIRFACKLESEA